MYKTDKNNLLRDPFSYSGLCKCLLLNRWRKIYPWSGDDGHFFSKSDRRLNFAYWKKKQKNWRSTALKFIQLFIGCCRIPPPSPSIDPGPQLLSAMSALCSVANMRPLAFLRSLHYAACPKLLAHLWFRILFLQTYLRLFQNWLRLFKILSDSLRLLMSYVRLSRLSSSFKTPNVLEDLSRRILDSHVAIFKTSWI